MNCKIFKDPVVMKVDITPTDHGHYKTYDETCSRCRYAIGENEVPLILWSKRDPNLMWAYCEVCQKAVLLTKRPVNG